MTYVEFLHAESEFIASNRTDIQSLLIPGISFSLVPRKYLGEALFSRSLYAELRGSHNALGSDSDFLQVRMQAEHVFDLFAPKWHVLVRGDIGATAVSRTSRLAPSQRFFAGGDRSVRGFGFNDLSPVEQATDANGDPLVDEDGNPIYEKVGGKHLFAGSVELDSRCRFEVRGGGVRRRRQRVRQFRRSIDVFRGDRRAIAPAGGFRGYRCRAGADHARGQH